MFARQIILSGLLLFAGIATADNPDVTAVVQLLAEIDDPAVQKDLLKGMRAALRGQQRVAMPDGWSKVYARLSQSPDAEVREHAIAIALLFGDPQALASLRKLMLSTKEQAPKRLAALATLVETRAPALASSLQQLLGDRNLRGAAVRGLAAYDDAKSPGVILKHYRSFNQGEKQDAIATLASRKGYALALLDGVERKVVARTDISAYIARQLSALGDPSVSKRLEEVWGKVRESPKAKQEQIARIKALLKPGFLSRANRSNGRLIFSKTCQQCHTLFGVGNQIGPDLTGSNRADLDYILANMIDPSAEIGQDYQMKIVATRDGRVLTGLVVERSAVRLVIQTANEKIVVSLGDVEEEAISSVSMMPEGQLDKLTKDEIRDLIVYLGSKKQVPLPKGASKK